MLDVTWKLFCQTGNIEAYLLLKELENDPNEKNISQTHESEPIPFNQKM